MILADPAGTDLASVGCAGTAALRWSRTASGASSSTATRLRKPTGSVATTASATPPQRPWPSSVSNPNRSHFRATPTDLSAEERSFGSGPNSLFAEDRLEAVRRPPKSHRIVGAIAEANEGFDVAAFMSGMSPEQRCILGFPSVGSEYWTAETIAATAARYPEMDMAPYEEAASVSAAASQHAKL